MKAIWVITPEGRELLLAEQAKYATLNDFNKELGCGRNQIDLIHKNPNKTFANKTIDHIKKAIPAFRSGLHYNSVEKAEGREINLIRDLAPTLNVTRGELRSLGNLYQAVFENPKYQGTFTGFDSVEEFRSWFEDWGNAKVDSGLEMFFVYRLYQKMAIAFLYGELHKPSPDVPLYVFAIWYLIGTENASYVNAKNSLSQDTIDALPPGERDTAKSLMIRLLEELHDIPTLDYIAADIEAVEVGPDSHSRKLLRLYAKVENEISLYFAHDERAKSHRRLHNRRFYVLDFPYGVPHVTEEAGNITVRMTPSWFLCCPMREDAVAAFRDEKVAISTIIPLLKSVYAICWVNLEADDPTREVIRLKTDAALAALEQQAVERGGWINRYTLPDFIKNFFDEGRVSSFANAARQLA